MTGVQTLGLLALSLLASASWFVDDLLPAEGPPLSGEGFRLLFCSVLTLGVLALRRRAALPGSGWRYVQVAAVSLGVVALPLMLLNAARGRIASTDSVLIFTLMPIATMLIANSRGAEQSDLGSLPPVLLASAGVMILLPVRLPAGRDGMLGAFLLVAAMLLSAASIVLLHRLLRGISLHVAIPSICLINGLFLSATASAVSLGRLGAEALWLQGLRALLFDLPQVVLLIWLLKMISPQRLAGRYLIAPLFTVIEGLILVRPHVDLRTFTGLGLLTVGSAMALFGRQTSEPDGLGLNLS